MSFYPNYNIDFTPESGSDYWRVDLDVWVFRRGDPESDRESEELSTSSEDVVRAHFLLALTCNQAANIRRGRSMGQIWDRLENIFQYAGPVGESPLFRQLAHQNIDERPESIQILREFLDELEEEDTSPIHPSPLTMVKKLVTEPEVFVSRRSTISQLESIGLLRAVGLICRCHPYAPVNEVRESELLLLTCPYCRYDTAPSRTVREGDDNDDVQEIPLSPAAVRAGPRWKPYMKTLILSFRKITSIGFQIIFKYDRIKITPLTEEAEFLDAREEARWAKMELDGVRTQPPGYGDLQTWHRRLGHIDLRDFLPGFRQGSYKDLKMLEPMDYDVPPCRACSAVKLPGMPFRQVLRVGTRVLEVVHSDFCGPIPGRSEDEHHFFISFTDDASGWMKFYLVNNGAEILDCLRHYVAKIENKFGQTIEILQSTDCMGNDFDDYLREKGIARSEIPTDINHARDLLETAKCLLVQAGLDDKFYREALFTACYIRNRCSLAKFDGLTPYQKWFGRKPSLRHMHEFGAKVTCRVITDPDTMIVQTKEGMYLGFDKRNRAYRILVPDFGDVFYSRDVDFHENVYPPVETPRLNPRKRRRYDSDESVEILSC